MKLKVNKESAGINSDGSMHHQKVVIELPEEIPRAVDELYKAYRL